jgi:hypothetical protein
MQIKLKSKTKNSIAIGLTLLLLASSLPLLLVSASGDSNSNMLSPPVELNTELPGTVGYCVYQLEDGSLVLNSVNQSCTFLEKLDPSYHLLWAKPIQISQNNTALTRLLVLQDGGYLLAGIVNNLYTLVRTDGEGNILWIKTYSSDAPINYLMAIVEASDGGFAIAGFGEPVEDGLGWIWFAKTDALGNMQWSKNISGPNADCPSTIIQTSGGYVLSDVSYSFVPDQAFYRLIRLDAEGAVLGNSSYGGYGYYYQPECNRAIVTGDGGYLMMGYLWRKPAWVVKTGNEDEMQWNRTYGENGCSITDGLESPSGYLFVEFSSPNCTGVILTDKAGNQLWNTTFSNVTLPVGLEANFNTIIEAKDGGYFMVASKNQAVWLAKLDYPKGVLTAFQFIGLIELALAATLFLTWALKRGKIRKVE